MPITPRFDTPGAVTRSVEDLILFDTVLKPQQQATRIPSLAGVRLGLPSYHWSGLDSETERQVQRTRCVLSNTRSASISSRCFGQR